MANVGYPIGMKAILDAGINFGSDNIAVALIDTGTSTYNAAHDFWDDISSGLVGTLTNLASKTTTGGVFDAADTTISAVSGSTAEALVLVKNTGTASTSNLLFWVDTGVTGLPLTPNGGDVTIQWHASGIFSIG